MQSVTALKIEVVTIYPSVLQKFQGGNGMDKANYMGVFQVREGNTDLILLIAFEVYNAIGALRVGAE